MKKLFVLVLMISMVIGFVPAFVLPAMAEDIETVVFGQEYHGTLTATNTSDQYTVVLTEPGRLSLNITNDTFSATYNNVISVHWLDEAGTIISSVNHSFGSLGNTAYSVFTDLEPGMYYFRVQRLSNFTGAYFLTANFNPANNSDSERGLERNNTRNDAYPPMLGEQVKGFISHQNEANYYAIVLAEPGRLSVSVTNGTFSTTAMNVLSVHWLDDTDAAIRSNNHYFGSTGNVYTASVDLEAGTYYIYVQRLYAYSGTYFLTANLAPSNNTDFESGLERNNVRDKAYSTMLEEHVKGFISHQYEENYYSIVLTEPGRLSVNVTNGTFSTTVSNVLSVHWLDGTGAAIRSNNHYFGSLGNAYTAFMDLEAGTYYIHVQRLYAYTGTYFLTTSFTSAHSNTIKPNGTYELAQPISSGQQMKGFLSHQEHMDWYKVELTQAGRLSVNITRDTLPAISSNVILVNWYDSVGEIINTRNHSFGSSGNTAYNTSVDLAAGTYYIFVERIGTNTGAYFLKAEFPPNNMLQTWYTVTYNANGGTGAPETQTKMLGKDIALSNTLPARANFTFLGWATTNGALVAQYQPGDIYAGNANLALFAVWEAVSGAPYTVTYNANWGTAQPNPQIKTHGVNLTLSTVIPRRDNHNFLGWASSAYQPTNIHGVEEYYPGDLYTTDASATLFAVWEPTASSYTIKYDANDGIGAPQPQVKTHGTSLRLSNIRPTRDGFVFLGWARIKTASAAQYAPGINYSMDANRILYAVWTATGTGPVAMSGTVNSYNPNNTPVIELWQGGVLKYTATITSSTASSGHITQRFNFEGIAQGNYELRVTKPGHLSYTKLTLTIGSSNIDFGGITLIPGDINGDGQIDGRDFTILSENFGRSGHGIANTLADINGDGQVDGRDFTLLSEGFGKSAVVEP